MVKENTLFARLFKKEKSGKEQKKKRKVVKKEDFKEPHDIQDCIKFANDNPICFLATVDGDKPHVRAMGFWFADETGFYFQSSTVKELIKQLEQNKNVEICFYKHEGMIGNMLRIEGLIEFINDIKLKEKVLEERPFLKSFGLTINSPGLVIFRISHGKAHFWTMKNNLGTKEYIKF